VLAGVQDWLADEGVTWEIGLMATNITFAPKGTLSSFDTVNCDAWVIENIASIDDFIALYDEKSQACPGHHLFASFDWYDQACYTSGHAMGKYDLDPPDDIELPDAKYTATHNRFMALTGKLGFDDLAGRLVWSQDDEESPSLLDINANPGQCLDAKIVMQIVPVNLPEDGISTFPNGYFCDDLTPFESHALGAHFRQAHGLKLIAMGASYMCFLRDEILSMDAAALVVADIMTLHEPTDELDLVGQLATILTGKRYLILSYADH
jgi:hypothetical protein